MKPGQTVLPCCVDGPGGLDRRGVADEDDLAGVDDEVGVAGRRARAVDQAAVTDDQVGHVSLRRSRARRPLRNSRCGR